MRHLSRALVPALGLLLTAAPALAVIKKLTHLDEVLESQKFIFVAAVEKVDPEKPSVVLTVEKKLKGEPPFERLPVNMTGDDDARKAGDTKTILDRLDPSRKVVVFAVKQNGLYEAMAFVEGSWFSLQGTPDPETKTVRWAFLHGEPFLRRTYKGTTAEMVKVIEDGLAKKAKPPMADENEKPGFGPPVTKKCGTGDSECGVEDGGLDSAFRAPHSALFGVIPSVVLLGPLALVAALFPGVFARMAIGMKRWRAFLVVASINSTLALVYWLVQEHLPAGRAFGIKAFTLYLTTISAVGLLWAGRRYRRMAAEDAALTNVPGRTEIGSLAGLTAFAALLAVGVAWFANWQWETNLELPLREFTFIGVALLAATVYAGYRYVTRGVDAAVDRRLSLSGESVGLATLVLCGFTTLVAGGSGAVAVSTESGDAEAIGPRLVSARAIELYEVDDGSKDPLPAEVLSGVVVSGDRLFMGLRNTGFPGGRLVCVNPETGEVAWSFREKLKPVFCTPTIADGKLYCGEGLHEDRECRLFGISAADGKPAWAEPVKTGSHTEGTPAVAGGKLFFPAGDDGLIAVDAKTGTQRLWQLKGGKDAGIHIDAAPAVSGNRVFVGSGLYSFVAVALDTETGKELWRTDLKLRSFAAPVVLGKAVHYGVGTGNMAHDTEHYPEEGEKKDGVPAGAVVALDTETGKELWRLELPKAVHVALAGDAFSVYAASRDGSVYAIDRKTGKLRWKTGLGSAIMAPPAVAASGGVPVAVYAVGREGLLACLNPHTGKVVWQKQLPGYTWSGKDEDGVLSGPTVVTTPTATGSKRTVYVGGMTVDPNNPAKKTAAVFRFDDEIGGE
ncbi:PQQ enzyme repeat domain protein OS=Haloferax sp. ATCC BAA-645 GN=C459_15691 PE=4 SV=1: PQQ_2: PQQ_2 [Gemmataceae bacterium]|nr:PQQ enzyme repeat domain protein OS=Haloferax sp. ATCC BAA-645 GN=C459_15691 PE=4 SV=1: PQQ_2: PQQ_2 [Gemmataceae bacterium]VTU00757.1 PQQ enzyme repeat domain protein OS=Haloferax sp. ATCC BAA-645 GN=C459_15691 PE=4 SV=1: PQQ_2: PQQ_2 [Gemmataceae bacterium]